MDQDNNQKDPQTGQDPANVDPVQNDLNVSATVTQPAEPEAPEVAEAPTIPEPTPATEAQTPEAVENSTPEVAEAQSAPEAVTNLEPAMPEPAMPAPEAATPEPTTPPEPEAATPAPATPTNPTTPTTPEIATPTPATACGCANVSLAEWDKQHKQIDKTFYTTPSPRIFYMPFSFAIDVDRAKRGAKNKGYSIVENGLILDNGGMFKSTLMVEVTGADTGDKNVISLAGKNLYTKASTKPWNQLRQECQDLEKEMGKKPTQLYFWYTACPKCKDNKEVKTVLLAVE